MIDIFFYVYNLNIYTKISILYINSNIPKILYKKNLSKARPNYKMSKQNQDQKNSKEVIYKPKLTSSFAKKYAKRAQNKMFNEENKGLQAKKIADFNNHISEPMPYYKIDEIEELWEEQSNFLADFKLIWNKDKRIHTANYKGDEGLKNERLNELIQKMAWIYDIIDEEVIFYQAEYFSHDTCYTGFKVKDQQEGYGIEINRFDDPNLEGFCGFTKCEYCEHKILKRNAKYNECGYVLKETRGKWQMGLKHGDIQESLKLIKAEYCNCCEGFDKYFSEWKQYHFDGSYFMGLKEGYGTEYYTKYDCKDYSSNEVEQGNICYAGNFKYGERHGEGILYNYMADVVYSGSFYGGLPEFEYKHKYPDRLMIQNENDDSSEKKGSKDQKKKQESNHTQSKTDGDKPNIVKNAELRYVYTPMYYWYNLHDSSGTNHGVCDGCDSYDTIKEANFEMIQYAKEYADEYHHVLQKAKVLAKGKDYSGNCTDKNCKLDENGGLQIYFEDIGEGEKIKFFVLKTVFGGEIKFERGCRRCYECDSDDCGHSEFDDEYDEYMYRRRWR